VRRLFAADRPPDGIHGVRHCAPSHPPPPQTLKKVQAVGEIPLFFFRDQPYHAAGCRNRLPDGSILLRVWFKPPIDRSIDLARTRRSHLRFEAAGPRGRGGQLFSFLFFASGPGKWICLLPAYFHVVLSRKKEKENDRARQQSSTNRNARQTTHNRKTHRNKKPIGRKAF